MLRPFWVFRSCGVWSPSMGASHLSTVISAVVVVVAPVGFCIVMVTVLPATRIHQGMLRRCAGKRACARRHPISAACDVPLEP